VLKPNLEQFLALPAQTGPDMSDEDWEAEMSRMFKASQLTHRFVLGQLSPVDFSDGVADLGYNPDELADMWDIGQSLGY
jgi:hypothetical protein